MAALRHFQVPSAGPGVHARHDLSGGTLSVESSQGNVPMGVNNGNISVSATFMPPNTAPAR